MILNGSKTIRDISGFIPSSPGVYQMLNADNKIIYIGKAKDLQKRVYNYSQPNLNYKTALMVSLVASVKWIVTNSEKEALILEADLIRNVKPHYNVLLKDDKSRPFIKFSLDDAFPRISNFRSRFKTKSKGLLGPFASSKESFDYIKMLQKLFLLRTCSDTFFSNRVTPCILYQIKRCSAPCVGKISEQDYAASVKQATNFLNGNNKLLQETLSVEMNNAKQQLDFEKAIIFRDRLLNLNKTLAKQSVLLNDSENADFIVIMPVSENISDNYFITLFMLRNGHNYGFIDKLIEFKIETSITEALEYFLLQYYNTETAVENIYVNIDLDSVKAIEGSLSDITGTKTNILRPNNTQKRSFMQIVLNTANELLQRHTTLNTKWLTKFDELKSFFNLSNPINRIEVYDNSHFFGELPLGIMINATVSGFDRNAYRIFNVKNQDINSSDDYGIMKEVFTRRFGKPSELILPDLIFVDGGKGQLNVAKAVLDRYNINIPIVAIAKPENRNSGKEKLFFNSQVIENNIIPLNILHFIQQLRNEAHRFAVARINKRKSNSLKSSGLDGIKSIGKKRKTMLLNYFGSIDAIKKATVDEISKAPLFNAKLATIVVNYFADQPVFLVTDK